MRKHPARASDQRSMTTNDPDAQDVYECPTCDYTTDAPNGVGIHHHHAHGESIAKVEVECEFCGDTVEKYRCNIKDSDRVFCGPACRGKFWEALPPEEQPTWKGGDVEVECWICGSKIEVGEWRVERTNRFVCGDACKSEWASRTRSGEQNPLYNSVEIECDWCGETTTKIPARIERSKRDFCSHECHSKWEAENLIGERSPHWKGGRRDYGPGWHEKKRRAVRERDGFECRECGKTQTESIEAHGRKLDVHHLVNPAKSINPAVHNAPRNLVTLCIPCHQRREADRTRQVTFVP